MREIEESNSPGQTPADVTPNAHGIIGYLKTFRDAALNYADYLSNGRPVTPEIVAQVLSSQIYGGYILPDNPINTHNVLQNVVGGLPDGEEKVHAAEDSLRKIFDSFCKQGILHKVTTTTIDHKTEEQITHYTYYVRADDAAAEVLIATKAMEQLNLIAHPPKS